MSGPVTVCLQRSHGMEPWGFRLQGGRDFRERLSVKKVTRETPAAGAGLRAGDAIVSISGYDTSDMTHTQASQMIKQAGGVLQLTLDKGGCREIRPTGPVKFSTSTAQNYVR